jgi:hypothetical protein
VHLQSEPLEFTPLGDDRRREKGEKRKENPAGSTLELFLFSLTSLLFSSTQSVVTLRL